MDLALEHELLCGKASRELFLYTHCANSLAIVKPQLHNKRSWGNIKQGRESDRKG